MEIATMIANIPAGTPLARRIHPRLNPVLLALLLALAPLWPISAPAAGAEILVPPDKALIHAKNPAVTVVVRVKGAARQEKLQIRSGDLLFSPQGMWPVEGNWYAHFQVPLKAGSNTFELLPAGKTVTVTFRPLRSLMQINRKERNYYQFHGEKLLPAACAQCHDTEKITRPGKAEEAAQSFCFSCHGSVLGKTPWQHSPAVNFQCLACHKQGDEPLRIAIPAGKVEDTCFRCHINKKSWLDKKHIHGPVGTGDCTICHNPHGDINRGQLWAEGKDSLCVACHTDKRNMVSRDNPAFYVHGILRGIGCTICHDPHAEDHRFMLHKPINDLCVSCHTSLAGVTRGHPVGGHPVAGAKDPRRPERNFTCTSCHNPHDSNFKYLLIGDILGGHICSQCHY